MSVDDSPFKMNPQSIPFMKGDRVQRRCDGVGGIVTFRSFDDTLTIDWDDRATSVFTLQSARIGLANHSEIGRRKIAVENLNKVNWPRIAEYIRQERIRQIWLWGDGTHTKDRFLTIMVEEVGEVARAILERDPKQYRKELIEVAAVAARAIQAINQELDNHADSEHDLQPQAEV